MEGGNRKFMGGGEVTPEQANVLRLKFRIARLEAALRCLGCGWLVDQIREKEVSERGSTVLPGGSMAKITMDQGEREQK